MKAKKPLPTPDYLRQRLRYDPETGHLFWLARTPDMFEEEDPHKAAALCAKWNNRYAGQPAFTTKRSEGKGYLRGTILGRNQSTHRVAWCIYYGEWPDFEIDHINGVRDDNRLSNLRMVTASHNMRNKPIRRDMGVGYRGVRMVGDKYHAQIQFERTRISLGFYDTKRDAALAYDVAARFIDGEFAHLNLNGL